jgi:hypothetical protein
VVHDALLVCQAYCPYNAIEAQEHRSCDRTSYIAVVHAMECFFSQTSGIGEHNPLREHSRARHMIPARLSWRRLSPLLLTLLPSGTR